MDSGEDEDKILCQCCVRCGSRTRRLHACKYRGQLLLKRRQKLVCRFPGMVLPVGPRALCKKAFDECLLTVGERRRSFRSRDAQLSRQNLCEHAPAMLLGMPLLDS